jgi:transposase-like protein
MGPEVRHGGRKFTREFKLEAVRLIKDRGVSYVQAS